jgi:hypothetical protein
LAADADAVAACLPALALELTESASDRLLFAALLLVVSPSPWGYVRVQGLYPNRLVAVQLLVTGANLQHSCQAYPDQITG